MEFSLRRPYCQVFGSGDLEIATEVAFVARHVSSDDRNLYLSLNTITSECCGLLLANRYLIKFKDKNRMDSIKLRLMFLSKA